MTVEELITKLQSIEDKSRKILIESNDFELQGSKVEASMVFPLPGNMEQIDFGNSKSVFSYNFDGDIFYVIK